MKINKVKILLPSACIALFASSASLSAEESKKPAEPAVIGKTLLRFSSESLQSVLLSHAIGNTGIFRTTLGASKDEVLGMAASGEPDSWSLWMSPAYSTFRNTIEPFTSKGKVLVGLAGVEYNHEDESFAGISIALDKINADTTYNAGTIRGNGYTISPYFMHYLSSSWILTSSFGRGESSFTSEASGVKSSPKTQKTLFSAGLTNFQTYGNIYATYKVAYNFFKDDTPRHTNSAGGINDSLENRLSQVQIGGQFLYNTEIFKPFLGIYHYVNNSDSSALGRSPQEYKSTNQYILGLNFSKDQAFGSIAQYREKDKSQVRFYIGVRY